MSCCLTFPSPPKLDAPAFEKILTTQRALDAEIERRIRPKLPTSLPPEDEARVDKLFSQKGVISKCNREQVTATDLSRLRPNQWLNDEIINFYGQMIMARAEASQQNAGSNGRKKPLNVHYFNTFFWSKLGEGYKKSKLARWTKKIDIFAKDVILIPINHNNSHWTAAAINFHKRRIESYDSMGMQRRNVFKLLREYLNAEHMDKRGRPFDFTGWKDYVLEDTPQQENGFDCGVFTCQFLETLARGEEKFLFKQANMPYLRRRMVLEIGNTKLHHDL
ncbi:cysteine proteinase [Daedalea quercina L-15889]|uniref:Cysteine proteinase n=1 Tax=Daedalea quercina L-15889 TaxID=1314783 RepID=A0A165UFV2_9APHY|nr:cysteine proteinase [Daedalea quercina L-15889]